MIIQETFFRPEILEQQPWMMPADAYNRTRRLLTTSPTHNVFVPIRTMQYLAVIDLEEIVFIDAVGGYGYHHHQGGRLIQLAWREFHPQTRQAITDAVPCFLVYYLPSAKEAMKRLAREFTEALIQMEQRVTTLPMKSARILPFPRHD
jgi:hypothetical protein